MPAIQRFVLALAVLGMTACASRPSAAPAAGGPARWSGSFKQTTTPPAGTFGPATPNRGYGMITLNPIEGTAGRMRVELSINAPVPAGTQVAWAIFTGACGSPSPMVTGANEFPTIAVGTDGSGSVRTELPLALDPRGSYHANVYWTSRVGSGLDAVMMCANLTFGAR